MNEILDREDYIPDAYTFEVSSPGLGRPLKKDKDFERSLGEKWRSGCIGQWIARKNMPGY